MARTRLPVGARILSGEQMRERLDGWSRSVLGRPLGDVLAEYAETGMPDHPKRGFVGDLASVAAAWPTKGDGR